MIKRTLNLLKKWLKIINKLQLGKYLVLLGGLTLAIAHCSAFITALLRIELIAPCPTPIFEDRFGTFLTDGASEYERLGFWQVQGDIPQRIKQCIIGIEDKRFYSHPGVDIRSLARALFTNIFNQSEQGASTIAMQVARLQNPAERNIYNKLIEMYTGIFLVIRFGHEDVLRHYMRIVPQGNQMFGFAYAARRYFRKPLKDLSWAEAAVLASLPKAPGRMNLFQYGGFQKALSRARIILNILYRDKSLDQDTYYIAIKQLGEIYFRYKETRPADCYHYIFRLLQDTDIFKNEDCSQPVRTSLDMNTQRFLSELARESMQKYRPLGAGNIALIVVDKNNGQVLGYVGADDYFNQQYSGSINYACTPRSAGSTLKPFLYALGLDRRNYSPASILADLPLHVVGIEGEYTAENFDDNFLGPLLYRKALANSRNIPAVRVLMELGVERVYNYFQNLGLVHSQEPASYYGYGLVIGGLYVTLEDLVRDYGILANDGHDFQLNWIMDRESVPAQQKISVYASRSITLFLSDPLARQPAFSAINSMNYNFPVAIKTGTSQGFRDAWTVAYSNKYIVGVWIGEKDNQPMNHVSGSVAAGIVKSVFSFLQPAESQGINEEPFPLPLGVVAVKLCQLSGQVAGPDCTEVSLEYFRQGTEPHTVCSVHRRYAVDRRTGTLATGNTLTRDVVTRKFTVLPAQYASWGIKQGYGEPPALFVSKIPETKIRIMGPIQGSRLIIDPETPLIFQTIALKVEVTPAVAEVVWYVDGREYERVCYPYETRWQLAEGRHTFRACFPHANVVSQVVTIEVEKY